MPAADPHVPQSPSPFAGRAAYPDEEVAWKAARSASEIASRARSGYGCVPFRA